MASGRGAARAERDSSRIARALGLGCVRIVHGKGRGSGHRGPVLKAAVNRWLRRTGPCAPSVPRAGRTAAPARSTCCSTPDPFSPLRRPARIACTTSRRNDWSRRRRAAVRSASSSTPGAQPELQSRRPHDERAPLARGAPRHLGAPAAARALTQRIHLDGARVGGRLHAAFAAERVRSGRMSPSRQRAASISSGCVDREKPTRCRPGSRSSPRSNRFQVPARTRSASTALNASARADDSRKPRCPRGRAAAGPSASHAAHADEVRAVVAEALCAEVIRESDGARRLDARLAVPPASPASSRTRNVKRLPRDAPRRSLRECGCARQHAKPSPANPTSVAQSRRRSGTENHCRVTARRSFMPAKPISRLRTAQRARRVARATHRVLAPAFRPTAAGAHRRRRARNRGSPRPRNPRSRAQICRTPAATRRRAAGRAPSARHRRSPASSGAIALPQQHDGLGRDAFAAAERAEAFHRRRLDVDAAAIDAESRRRYSATSAVRCAPMRGASATSVRSQFTSRSRAQRPASRPRAAAGGCRRPASADRRREMLADVAERRWRRATRRISACSSNVTVRMCDDAAFVAGFARRRSSRGHPARTRARRIRSDPHRRPRGSPRSADRCGEREIRRPRDLDVERRALDQPRLQPQSFDRAGLVGRIRNPRARCARCSARNNRPNRNICGVSARQSPSARHGCPALRSSSSARFSVSLTGTASSPPTGSRRQSATAAGQVRLRGTQGRAASCTSTQSSGRRSSSACSPLQHRQVAARPAVAGDDPRRLRFGSARKRRSPGASDDHAACEAGYARSARTAVSEQALAGSRMYCLGIGSAEPRRAAARRQSRTSCVRHRGHQVAADAWLRYSRPAPPPAAGRRSGRTSRWHLIMPRSVRARSSRAVQPSFRSATSACGCRVALGEGAVLRDAARRRLSRAATLHACPADSPEAVLEHTSASREGRRRTGCSWGARD